MEAPLGVAQEDQAKDGRGEFGRFAAGVSPELAGRGPEAGFKVAEWNGGFHCGLWWSGKAAGEAESYAMGMNIGALMRLGTIGTQLRQESRRWRHGEALLWLAEQSAYDVWQAGQRFKAAPMHVIPAPMAI